MQASEENFNNLISSLDADSLRALCSKLYQEKAELHAIQRENDRINAEVKKQYTAMRNECDRLRAECKSLKDENVELKRELSKANDTNKLRAKSTFGRKSEKLMENLYSTDEIAVEHEDEAQEEDAKADTKQPVENKLINVRGYTRHLHAINGSKSNKKHGPNPLHESMKNLPKRYKYLFNIDELNRKYGRFGWRFVRWHAHSQLKMVECPYYEEITYTPVISCGLEHIMLTEPYQNMLLDRSVVSPSLMAYILYLKFMLALPYYRQSINFSTFGLDISRQTMINWTSRIVPRLFTPVVEYLTECLTKLKYNQCDETRTKVNKDKRNGFMWVHCSSELLECNPIIVFCYEATRSTEHLRSFYSEFLGYISCDAYISYQVLEEESGGEIKVPGCFMHCRRYFAEALFVNDLSGLTNEQLIAMPEMQALLLIRDIYAEENPIKGMPAEQHRQLRQENVKTKVDAFFAFVHKLRDSKQAYSERMEKAITYAINQESHLRLFLEDGNIPIDNGHAERIIRSYSVGRANWLFADTVEGAEIYALMYSVVETAKANNANVYMYLQYLLEEMPRHVDETDRSYLADMMPWSDAYHRYELNRQNVIKEDFRRMFPIPEKPRTPRKRDCLAS